MMSPSAEAELNISGLGIQCLAQFEKTRDEE